ncbi:hypothetical protein ACFL6L_03520 [candidate division KSB1 bacterium]
MNAVRECLYLECYNNDNVEHCCLIEKITVGPTGICESLMHCDEFVCADCERFEVCLKPKKEQFLEEN